MLNKYTAVPDITAILQSSNLYIYCLNNPIKYMDQNGLWTIGVGGEAAAAFAARLSLGGQIVVDDDWNVGILVCGGVDGGFLSASLSASATGTATFTTAESIDDLGGFSFVGGGSFTIPAGILAGANMGAKFTTNGEYIGATFALGAGTSLPEAHAEISGAYVIDITNLLKFLGLYDDAIDIAKDSFNSLSDEQKEYVEENFGVSIS